MRAALLAAALLLGGCAQHISSPVVGTYYPVAKGMRPGAPVVVRGGSAGGEPLQSTGAALARAGLPTLALAYFGEPGLPEDLESIPLEYFARAVRWLDGRPGVDGRRTVVVGSSRGSEAALLLGAHFPRLVHGVIALSPANKVNPAVHRRAPAWALHGKPLTFALSWDAKGGFDAPAIIPVERIRAPVLLIAGSEDRIWRAPVYERAIVARLRRRHFGHELTALVLRGAGHGLDARAWRAELAFLRRR